MHLLEDVPEVLRLVAAILAKGNNRILQLIAPVRISDKEEMAVDFRFDLLNSCHDLKKFIVR